MSNFQKMQYIQEQQKHSNSINVLHTSKTTSCLETRSTSYQFSRTSQKSVSKSLETVSLESKSLTSHSTENFTGLNLDAIPFNTINTSKYQLKPQRSAFTSSPLTSKKNININYKPVYPRRTSEPSIKSTEIPFYLSSFSSESKPTVSKASISPQISTLASTSKYQSNLQTSNKTSSPITNKKNINTNYKAVNPRKTSEPSIKINETTSVLSSPSYEKEPAVSKGNVLPQKSTPKNSLGVKPNPCVFVNNQISINSPRLTNSNYTSNSKKNEQNELCKKIKINVKKSERFLDYDSKVPTYKTRSKKRGKVLMINNIKFNQTYEYRAGAEVDEKSLTELFKQMGFEIEKHVNKTAQEIQVIIKNYTKKSSLKNYDINVVVVMSHGNGKNTSDSTFILGKDGQYVQTTSIIEQFSNENCKYLCNKPKIFIFQCCRGDDVITKQVEHDSTRSYSDMLLAYATLPGFVSHRDVYEGTWYIQLICKIFMEHAHDTNVEDLLKMVDSELSRMQTLYGTMQTSTYENRGFKRCYFHPGLSS